MQFLEIPPSKMMSLADKAGYRFVDSKDSAQMAKFKQTIQKIDIQPAMAQKNVWIFQANPNRYDILSALADETFVDDVWLVSRYKDSIRYGDIGLIWMSGSDAGIYAIVDIMSNPQMMYDSGESTSESDQNQLRRRVKIHYKLKLVNYPLLKEELKRIPALQGMEILKIPRGTNFMVTREEWKAIVGVLESRKQ